MKRSKLTKVTGRKPRIAVIWFPGTNCDEEAYRAVAAAGMLPSLVRWNQDVSGYDGYLIPGGWSYEDRVRAGVIAARNPVMKKIIDETSSGKPVIGICNGAQVLVESGMVPGLEVGKPEMALAPSRNGYLCVWTRLKSSSEKGRSAFNKLYGKGDMIQAPIAHGEGRFTTSDTAVLRDLRKNDQIIFQYCDEKGELTEEANPNGSAMNIAGVCNKEGNVMALMPHPERASWFRNIPYHEQASFEENEGTTPSNLIFESMRRFIDEN